MTPDAAHELNEAARCYGRGDLRRAESLCRHLLENDPRATDVVHLLGLVRKKQGAFAEAEQLLRECIRREPQRADVHANFGNLMNAIGRLDEARAAYEDALRRHPGFRPARLGLARALLRAGRNEDALRESELLIADNEADVEALTVAGSALRALGRAGRAEAMLRRALELQPQRGVTRHNLGALLNDLSRSEEALAELEQAARLGVRGAEIDFNIASALMALNRFDEAEERLAGSLRTAPRDARTQRLLARLRFMRGNDHYSDELEQAVRGYPGDIVLRITHSQVLRGAGLPQSAADTILSAPDLSDARLQAELAAACQEDGRFDAAAAAAGAAIAADPGNAEFPDLMIDALMSLGRADDAMPLIASARGRRPWNQWYIAMEATAARVIGDPRYESWYDYDNLVQVFELEAPSGWQNIDAFHADLIPVLRDRHRFRAQPLDQSLRNGTQTPRGLLGDPDPRIQAFLDALAAPIASYRARAGFDPSHVFRARNRGGDARLTGCWSVRLGPGGFHVNHVHPEGWISSAYYLEVPAEAADGERKAGWLKFGEPRFPVPGVGAERYVQPVPGRLVLFPSYMWHGTMPIGGREPRMSIAFDAVPEHS